MREGEHDEVFGPGTGAHGAVEDGFCALDIAPGELEEDVEFPEGGVGAGCAGCGVACVGAVGFKG